MIYVLGVLFGIGAGVIVFLHNFGMKALQAVFQMKLWLFLMVDIVTFVILLCLYSQLIPASMEYDHGFLISYVIGIVGTIIARYGSIRIGK